MSKDSWKMLAKRVHVGVPDGLKLLGFTFEALQSEIGFDRVNQNQAPDDNSRNNASTNQVPDLHAAHTF